MEQQSTPLAERVGDYLNREPDRATPAPAQQEYLTSSQAAKLLDVHVNTIRRWTYLNYLPCEWTTGGQRRYALADLEAFVAGERRWHPEMELHA